jgi:hypothetical protein
MQKYISWEGLEEAVGIYYELAENDYYVIFTMGTMVKVSPDTIFQHSHHFAGYTPEIMETWPTSRLDSSITPEEIYHDLTTVYQLQTTTESNEINSVIKCAFKILLDNTLEREFTPVICYKDESYIVEFCTGINIVHDTTDDNSTAAKNEIDWVEHADSAIALREYDLMFPQVYAVITPDLELIICKE